MSAAQGGNSLQRGRVLEDIDQHGKASKRRFDIVYTAQYRLFHGFVHCIGLADRRRGLRIQKEEDRFPSSFEILHQIVPRLTYCQYHRYPPVIAFCNVCNFDIVVEISGDQEQYRRAM
ncbi:hypothetical protein COCCADRAFT_28988 [Bipolaris zeicola 26-R-13]|uniref:Uncharacterized protein n=1 Tax=Cochliobolus carbonum (strain 26-R-13) TaxID=930089 RepID=W6Y4N6_COCC2|nr:uncharacterized protein COCCADRAFT_28988 [Bipolaris zeicola 26-R-13]EUC30029.1 hypothetical protein COCCADRAFT_28988 [Bipolaris zeicola 26-R-13]